MRFNQYFIPVTWSTTLKANKLLRVMYGNLPVVLVRTNKGVAAYEDFCPHRGVALSQGSVKDNQIHCCYHGWTFDCENGANTFVPVKNAAVNCSLKAIWVKEAHDLIWLSSDPEATLPQLSKAVPASRQSGTIKANVLNTLENFMEGSHTHYVHDGLVRSKNKTRHAIKATIMPLANGFSVHYDAEPAKGLLTKLLPRKFQQLRSVNTYIHPSIAILEFFNSTDELVSSFEAILVDKGENTNYYARIFLNIGYLSHILSFIPHGMFKKIIAQDKRILEMQQENLRSFNAISFASDETDCVGKELVSWAKNNCGSLQKNHKFEVYW